MAMIVTGACSGCKYTDCVVVCPVDCFYEGDSMLYINPEECTECQACIPECPVEAIFHEDDVPENMHHFIDLNRRMSEVSPNITIRQKPLADA